jgi:hypothetical protein
MEPNITLEIGGVSCSSLPTQFSIRSVSKMNNSVLVCQSNRQIPKRTNRQVYKCPPHPNIYNYFLQMVPPDEIIYYICIR